MPTLTGRKLDQVVIRLVPKIVDTNPDMFLDDNVYWSFSQEQIDKYLKSLPPGYADMGTRRTKKMEHGKAGVVVCENSPCSLVVGFHPGYALLPASTQPKKQHYTDEDLVHCPTFDVVFSPIDKKTGNAILSAALKQFFVYQNDINNGALSVIGTMSERHRKGMSVLAEYLRKGTRVDARCDYGAGNGRVVYHIGRD